MNISSYSILVMTTRKPSAITWKKKKRKREGKRKNTRVPALDEISINVAQSRARHPAINPTLLSQFLATSPPPLSTCTSGEERVREREKNRSKLLFFPQQGSRKPGEGTAIIGGNRLVLLFQAERGGEGMDERIRGGGAQGWSVRLFHIKGTFCPALGFARWPEGVARHSAWGHIG